MVTFLISLKRYFNTLFYTYNSQNEKVYAEHNSDNSQIFFICKNIYYSTYDG